MNDNDPLLRLLVEFFELPANTRPEKIRQQFLPSWDSLATVQLVTEIEGTLVVKFDMDEIDQLRSYEQIRDVLCRKGFSFDGLPTSGT